MDKLDVSALPDGDLVFSTGQVISEDTANRIKANLSAVLLGRRIVVIGGGARLESVDNNVALQRIERKLDTLIAALAEDDDTPVTSLDGKTFQARDQSKGLG
jgi:hypothetical protein